MKIKVETSGNFEKTYKYFGKLQNFNKGKMIDILKEYGEVGLKALQQATPIDSGETASSWYYEISEKGETITLSWNNRNIEDGVPIAILIQYGHGTRNGGYVQPNDYINPALKPIFDNIAKAAWKEVSS